MTEPWSDARIGRALWAWRWHPPLARRVVTDAYELLITPGSYALTFVYGLTVPPGRSAGSVLDEIRSKILSLGGTGARIELSPGSRPTDLADALAAAGYRSIGETEVLVWELRDRHGQYQPPPLSVPEGLSMREVATDAEHDAYGALAHEIFGEPAPSADVLAGFRQEFHQRIETTGHSDRFLAWSDDRPVGLGGVERNGPLARFFGGGVRLEFRRQGIYGGLVRTRCDRVAERGAELAVVGARAETSGPILKHHGFRTAGSLRTFEARW